MTVQVPLTTGQEPAPVPVREQTAWSTRGIKILASGVIAVGGGAALLWYSGQQTGGAKTGVIWAGVIVLVIAVGLLLGLTPVVPGQARVIQLFGKYRGTIRE